MAHPSSGDGRPRLVGVGVGPGDPELVTVRGVRVLREADLVLVPVASADEAGRAEAIVLAHVDGERVRRVVFALDERDGLSERRIAAWEDAARRVADAFADGAATIAFATLGDPHVYSTFSYLAQGVRELVPDAVVETVPGVMAMQDLAARTGTSLCEGAETLALVPATAGSEQVRAALGVADTVVVYKGGRHMPALLDLLRETGRLDGAVLGSHLGLADQDILPLGPSVQGGPPPLGPSVQGGPPDGAEADAAPGAVPYLSTVIVPARRSVRGGRL